jgi:hypothetical protein
VSGLTRKIELENLGQWRKFLLTTKRRLWHWTFRSIYDHQ